MTFTDFMSLVALTAPAYSGLQVAWKTGGGLAWTVGLIVGVASAACSFWGVKVFSRWVARHPKLSAAQPGALWIGFSWFLCVMLLVWICAFSFMAIWSAKHLIPYVAA